MNWLPIAIFAAFFISGFIAGWWVRDGRRPVGPSPLQRSICAQYMSDHRAAVSAQLHKIILKQAMNIGIAVAVDNGLIVPVIHDADQLSISGVNTRIRDISSRAHAGKLRLDELQGGTFTVNNTGWFGSVSSMPIINAPEVAILSMEAIVKRPRVIEIEGSDVIAIRHMMNMTCSFDHRVLDGAQVGFFLADVRKFLEEWDASTPSG